MTMKELTTQYRTTEEHRDALHALAESALQDLTAVHQLLHDTNEEIIKRHRQGIKRSLPISIPSLRERRKCPNTPIKIHIPKPGYLPIPAFQLPTPLTQDAQDAEDALVRAMFEDRPSKPNPYASNQMEFFDF